MPFKGFCHKQRGVSTFSAFGIKLPEWTSSDSLCWYSAIILNINDCLLCQQCQLLEPNFCLLSIWTAFYQGIKWCTVISINITPPGGDVEAQHFSQQKVIKSLFFCLSILRHTLLFQFVNHSIPSCSMFVRICLVQCIFSFYLSGNLL